MHKKLLILAAIAAIVAPQTIVMAKAEGQNPNAQDKNEIRIQKKEARAQEGETVEKIEVKKVQAQQKRLEFQDKKEKLAQDKCKNIENKIANRVKRYENNGQMLQKVYGNMKTRLDRLAARLKAAGANTTQLEADLQVLYGKIDKLYADQAAFVTTLKESQTFVCEKSESEFKGKLEQARKVPEVVKQDREDIKKFFQTTIKADLQKIMTELGQQVQAPGTETETEVDAERQTVKVKKEKKNSETSTMTTGTTNTSESSASTSTSSSTSTTGTTTQQ